MTEDDADGNRPSTDPPAPEPGTRAATDPEEDGRLAHLRRTPRVAIARREIVSLRSEKTILLAVAIQVFVAAFSSFLVVGLVSLYDPGANQQVTVDAVVAGDASAELLDALDDTEGIDAIELDSPGAARRAFDNSVGGGVDVAIVANRSADSELSVTVVAPRESVRTTLVVARTRNALETLERSLRIEYAREGRLPVEPLALPDRVSASPYFSFSYTVLVPLLMFLPAFVSGSIAVDSLTEEVQRGTMELLRVAPVTLSDVVDAKLVSTASLAPLQAAAWLGLLAVQGTAIARPVALVCLVAGVSTAVVAVGVGIALLTPDRRQAQFLYSTGVLVLGAASLVLPEHPANTVAKLAVGSATPATWTATAGYVALGTLAYLAVRVGVARVDPEGL